MDSLKIQGFGKSWLPKVFFDFLIFLYNVTNIQHKTENFERRFKGSVTYSSFIADPLFMVHIKGSKKFVQVATYVCRYMASIMNYNFLL